MSLLRNSFNVAFAMLRSPSRALEDLRLSKTKDAIGFLLIVGSVTALLTPLQVLMGFEDVNGLHAGGQAEYLAMDISTIYGLGVEWRPVMIEIFYVFILLLTTGYLHIILRVIGGRGTIKDTLIMIAYGDAPGLLFGWIPYFATAAAVWAALIQLFLGPMVLHKISWTKSAIIFSVLLGAGIIEMALS